MKQIIRNNSLFYLPFALFVLAGLFVIILTDKFELHLAINSIVGNSAINAFFKYVTYVGDGLFLVLIAVVLMFWKFRSSLFMLVSYALAGGVTQIIKNFVFPHVDRPYLYYCFYNFKFTLVEGVEMHINNSFPSGHSTSAMCLAFCLAFLTENKFMKFLIFMIGLTAAFSRVYLSQHFFEDIYAGSIIGVTFSTLVAWMFYARFNEKMSRLDAPVYKVFRRNG